MPKLDCRSIFNADVETIPHARLSRPEGAPPPRNRAEKLAALRDIAWDRGALWLRDTVLKPCKVAEMSELTVVHLDEILALEAVA